MTIPKPVYGFVTGEVSDEFFGRTDLTKFELGVAEAYNFYVDYRGGLVFRGGHEFIAPVVGPVKLFKFGALDDDYVIMLGDQYMRFVRSGGYLLEDAKTITALTAAATGVATVAAHGYSTGDLVYLSGVVGPIELNQRYFEVGAVTTNTLKLHSASPEARPIDTTGFDAYVSGGTLAKVVTLTTPYQINDLADIKATQRRSVEMRFTSLKFPRHQLIYTNDTTWTLTEMITAPSIAAPTNLSLTPSAAGDAGVAFAVTAVIDDVEGQPSEYEINRLSVNYVSGTAGSMQVSWDSVTGAQSYNVYRSLLIPKGADITSAQELGYLGRAFGPVFTDNNITPDFTKTPPQFFNPFANGPLTYIQVTNGGSGYTSATATVNVSGGGGSGFSGYPIVSGEAIIAVVITNSGSGYSSPSVSFSGGTGATATVTVGKATGNNPRAFTMFQQRETYAGTLNSPMGLWASKPGTIDNFDVSSVINAGDGYSFTFDGVEVDPIQHLLALRTGLLAFSSSSITLLRAEEGVAVSGINALAEPQAYKGASAVDPLMIDLDVLFFQRKGTALNAMVYTEYTNSFSLQDVSVLAGHLFGAGRKAVRMQWVAEPSKLLYCVREDGLMVSTTYERAQEVFAFTQVVTKGLFEDAVAIEENARDMYYTVVSRLIDGERVRYLERSQQCRCERDEDFWGVDAGLRYTLDEPDAQLTMGTTGTTCDIFASSPVFSAYAVGDIIYVNGAKLEITAVTSYTRVTAEILRDFAVFIPETDDRPRRAEQGAWSIGTPTDVLRNLWHLEGESISILADGNAYIEQVVANGQVLIDTPATKITAGLAYTGRVKTLPINIMQEITEGRRKAIKGVSTRLLDSRGLAIGTRLDEMEELPNRTDEDWGEAINTMGGSTYRHVNSGWDADQVIYYEQKYPLPATILSAVFDTELGDD